ncbi:MAG TPA: hypothetical protein VFW96_25215 [Thermomicrobiales bacterium]|nr:hypothetical protein [Thermomicrobiales bacterium]
MDSAATAVYLVIGHEDDPCCREVAAVLRGRGARVVATPEPLAGEAVFSWALGAGRSSCSLRLADGTVIEREALGGVLVRAQGGPYDAEGWGAADLGYARTETAAALVAWLWDLSCPVVNRLTPDLWFRFQRPLVDWWPLLRRHGVPAAGALITRDAAGARGYAERWGGAALYAPLTAGARYRVASEDEWAELGRLMARVPVCLLEPPAGPALYACVAGEAVVWDRPGALSGEERGALGAGLRALAGELGLGTLEAELRRVAGGVRCYGLGLYPRLERYDEAGRAVLARALTGLLGVAG